MVIQAEKDSCSYASFRNFLMLFFKRRKYRYYVFKDKTPHSLKYLVNEANKLGLDLKFFKDEKKELEKADTFPLFLLLNGKKHGHLIVIKKRKGEMFYIIDPAKGKYWLSLDKLKALYSGIYGIATKREKAKVKIKRPVFIKPLWPFVLFLSNFLQAVLLGLFFFYYQQFSLIWYFLIFLTLFLLINIGTIFLQRFILRSFDDIYSGTLKASKDLKNDFRLYFLFKGVLLSPIVSALPSFLFFLVLFILFTLNSWIFGCVSFLFFVLTVPLQVILEKKSQKEEFKLEKMEEDFVERGKDNFEKIVRKAERMAFKKALSKVLPYVFAVIFAAFPVLLEENFSLNFYLFQLFSLISLKEILSPFLIYLWSYSLNQKTKDLFFERFYLPLKG